MVARHTPRPESAIRQPSPKEDANIYAVHVLMRNGVDIVLKQMICGRAEAVAEVKRLRKLAVTVPAISWIELQCADSLKNLPPLSECQYMIACGIPAEWLT